MKLLYVDNRAYGKNERKEKKEKKKRGKGRSLERKKTEKKIGEEASTKYERKKEK